MRKAFTAAVILLFVGVQSSTAQQAVPAATPATVSDAQAIPKRAPLPATLMDGTPVKMRITQTISSADETVGEPVSFEVTDDISVDGVVLIAKGALGTATVTSVEKARRMGRAGNMNVNIDSVRLADGEKAQMRAVKDGQGSSHVGAMTGAMVATGIVFFPVAPLFLFMHGKDMVVPKGTEVTAFVQGDMKLDMAKFMPAVPGPPVVVMAAGAAPVPTVAAEKASINLTSTPAGADITINGSFVGNTPSLVEVDAGENTVVISKKGYQDWTRTLKIKGGTINLNAELDAMK